MMESPKKQEEDDGEDQEWIGPLPTEASEPQQKKRKVLQHEKLFLDK